MAKLRVLGENPPPPRGNGENQLRELRDYLTRLKDELEYLLTHLGEDNLDSGLTDSIKQIQTQAGLIINVNAEIEDINDALEGKQDTLTFDNVPTSGSSNPVKSGGIYTELQGKENADRFTIVNTGYITLSSATWETWISGSTYGILMLEKPAGYHPVSAEISRFSAWPTNLVPVCHHSNNNVYLLSQLAKADIGATRVAMRVLLEKD